MILLSGEDDEGDPLVISGSAAFLWELLVCPISFADLSSELSSRYGVPRATIARDIGPVLSELQRCDVVEQML